MVTVAALARKDIRAARRESKKFEFVLPTTLMGLEVEVDTDRSSETIFPHGNSLTYWNQLHDGSLVNGFEYTLRMPLSGDVLSEAISNLFAPPAQFHRTFTGSTHIHIDMLEEHVTLDVLRTMVLLVYTLEPILYHAGDASREWCGYANSLKSADSVLLSTLFRDNVASSFSSTYRRGGPLGRYYGLNLAALTDYGSLEFRYFPTATSPEELVRWVNLVQSFKKAAIDIGTPQTLANIIKDEMAYENMLNSYFSGYEQEVAALGGWRKVHSMFTKANIVSQDSVLRDVTIYDGAAVFADGKFAALATVAEEGRVASAPIFYDGGVPVPGSAPEGSVLVYNTRVYVQLNRGWVQIGENFGDNYYLSPETISALLLIFEDPHTYNNARSYDVNRIPSIAATGRLFRWNDPEINTSLDYSDDTADEYDDDDEEHDDDDDSDF